MIKKIFISGILSILFYTSTGKTIFAETLKVTPSTTVKVATPTSEIDKKVKILKEKIATKVAELEKKNKKALAGIIIKKDKDGFDLKTSKGDNYKVTVDDVVTKIFNLIGGAKKSIEFSGLKQGDLVVVSGAFIENAINATNIYKDEEYVVASGKIIEIDKSNFSIKVATTDKSEYFLDIESSTKQEFLDTKTLRFTAYGFSKLKIGDIVHFSAKKANDTKKNRLTLDRIITIPQESFVKK